MLRKVAFVLWLASVVVAAGPARAEEPDPRMEAATEAEEAEAEALDRLSLVGGSTLPEGERAVVVGYGWPALQIAGLFAPHGRFELGPMAQLLQGSPIMGLPFALGGELSVPMRLRLFTAGKTDFALAVRPFGMVGRASLVGLEGPDENDFGYGFGAHGGLRLGYRMSEKVALGLGALGSVDFIAVPNADREDVVATATGMVGIESLLTRATLFFLVAEAGYGFAPESYFDTHLVVRATLGFAHRQYR